MAPLTPELRRDLERAVVRARESSEAGARATITVLGIEAKAAPGGLSKTDRDLRSPLRARARALGGGTLAAGIDGLVEEIAYEQWHRMLFARFLAENGLLIHPSGAPVTMAEVVELAAEESGAGPWSLAASYGAEMLPGIFRAEDPAHKLRFAPEHRIALERILAELPVPLFTADDALGWVYQFWQAKRKAEVNRSGRKIGGADLPPVTQLFTEHYMVRFLLENSLGAWWAVRHPGSALLRQWEYLRFQEDGTPAAGAFPGWPSRAAEVTIMDPCCGSGHFLVAAAEMLRAMRIEEEGMSPAEAASAVLRQNLFGLEIDPRCTQLAAFALAFDAWKAGRYQTLPVPNIACTGIAVKGQLSDWRRLAGDDEGMRAAIEHLYGLFQDARELGSLIDPAVAAGEGLWKVDPDALLAKLERALRNEPDDPVASVFGAAAEGVTKAARLLAAKYWLVATNPPYLGKGLQSEKLVDYLRIAHPSAAADLGTSLIERFEQLGMPDAAFSFVSPQNWLYLSAYRKFRKNQLVDFAWRIVGRIGEGGFHSSAAAGAFACLFVLQRGAQKSDFRVVDAAEGRDPGRKAELLRTAPIITLSQDSQLTNPDSRVAFEATGRGPLLSLLAVSLQGIKTGDDQRIRRFFWEIAAGPRWKRSQGTSLSTEDGQGLHFVLDWTRDGALMARMQGLAAWGRRGVAVSAVRSLRTSLYEGTPFTSEISVVVPRKAAHLAAIRTFMSSAEYPREVRKIDPKVAVTNATLVKVPFDLERWRSIAQDAYPHGLPEPHSDEPTQWLFMGHPKDSNVPLQVAVARLLGYRWPDQRSDALDELADADGIVPLPALAGDTPAAERVRKVLARAYPADWSPALLDRLLADAGSAGATLESWLRDDFFAQHARLFQNRPFIWQIWDGRSDGFSALLNYHRLDKAALQKLTYTYLNDWIERQRAVREDPLAEDRRIAALHLQRRLSLILEGEPPHDIYTRWKTLDRQPVGWDPDLDDGVRLNIRPFVTAGILRARFTINWNKDRGADPGGKERRNDLHFTRAQKLAAREKRR